MRFRVRAVIPVVAITMVFIAWYWIGSIASRPEHALNATMLASMAVEEYVRQYGEWPTSWKELECVSASIEGVYSWPRDSSEIQTYVEIDFNVTLDELANQDLDEFRAIRPRGPAYNAYRASLSWLLEAVREVHEEQSDVDGDSRGSPADESVNGK